MKEYELVENKKREIQNRFRQEMGLLVDVVLQGIWDTHYHSIKLTVPKFKIYGYTFF